MRSNNLMNTIYYDCRLDKSKFNIQSSYGILVNIDYKIKTGMKIHNSCDIEETKSYEELKINSNKIYSVDVQKLVDDVINIEIENDSENKDELIKKQKAELNRKDELLEK